MQVMSQKMLGTAIRDQEVKHSELETAIRCTPVLSRCTELGNDGCFTSRSCL